MSTHRQHNTRAGSYVPATASNRARFFAVCTVCYLSGAISVWLLGTRTDDKRSKAPAAAAAPAAQRAHANAEGSAAKRRQVERPFLVRNVDACPGSDREAEQSYKAQQSAELMGLLRSMLKRAELTGVGGPEDVSAHLNQYLHGWADAFVRTAPDMFDEFSAEVEQLMCDKQARDTQLVMVSQLLQRIPELGSARSFECVVQRGKEDPVLWEALEAWKQTDVPLSPEMEKLAQGAQDERTRQALQRDDEGADSESREMEQPGPVEKANVESAPLQEKDVMLALRHAQRTGNAESEKALAATLARLRGAVTQ